MRGLVWAYSLQSPETRTTSFALRRHVYFRRVYSAVITMIGKCYFTLCNLMSTYLSMARLSSWICHMIGKYWRHIRLKIITLRRCCDIIHGLMRELYWLKLFKSPYLASSTEISKLLLRSNLHEKISRFWLAENKCIRMQHKCKAVTRAVYKTVIG